MWLHFDRNGKYRGFSTGPVFWIAVALIVGVVLLAAAYNLFILAPVIAVIGGAIWAWTWQIRRWRSQRNDRKPRAEQPG